MNFTQEKKLLETVFEDIQANIVRVLEGEPNEETPHNHHNISTSGLVDSLYAISEKTGSYGLSLSEERPNYTILERVQVASETILDCFEIGTEKTPQLASFYYTVLMNASKNFELQNKNEKGSSVCDGAYQEALKIVNATESVVSDTLRGNMFENLSGDGYTTQHLMNL